MTTGLVLIAAVLVLGAVIATVGDRLGMRVGKARLSLFNLRPRQTATLITILTGGIVSASTLGILFAVDSRLRTGVFELEKIQGKLSSTQQELEKATTEKDQIEGKLKTARREQRAAQRQLEQINQSLKAAIEQQTRTAAKLNSAQSQLKQVQGRFQQAQTLLRSVSEQAVSLQREIEQLQNDRQELIRQRDQVREQIAQRDQEIAQRNRAIQERETQLQTLETQRSFLVQEIQTLEREYQGLRQGNVALLRNQPLASGVVRISAPTPAQSTSAARGAVDQLLREANRTALARIRPGSTAADAQVIQISTAEVEQLINQIRDGKDYVIRIVSSGNYVVGEPCVLAGEACIRVFIAVAPNQIVFSSGEVIAATTVNPAAMNERELGDRISLLISAAQFRSRQAGVLAETLQIGSNTQAVIEFFRKVKEYNQPLDIQVVASQAIYTAGPGRIDLVAVQGGQTLFRTSP